MTTETMTVTVEITHKGPIKRSIANDLPRKIEQAAYDLIMARGGDCLNAKEMSVVEEKASE